MIARRPPVAISCGEPAGIGPEIAAAAWQTLRGDIPMLWLGAARHLPPDVAHQIITDPAQASEVSATALPVLHCDFGAPRTPGTAQPGHAPHVIDMIAQGVALVTSGAAAALTTAPIHKQALIEGAGFAHPGHTEYLADLAGVKEVVMLLAAPALRVVPVTIHIALEDVPAALTPAKLRRVIEITHAGLRARFGIEAPRIAVAGLNPHAGEGGLRGAEDGAGGAPVVERLAASGMTITGPHSADTMFHAAARATYDEAIAMYHDQALIPIKTIDFSGGVNVTLGLPFLRTSPDHGTAYDIAGKGIADPTSLIAALRMAAA